MLPIGEPIPLIGVELTPIPLEVPTPTEGLVPIPTPMVRPTPIPELELTPILGLVVCLTALSTACLRLFRDTISKMVLP